MMHRLIPQTKRPLSVTIKDPFGPLQCSLHHLLRLRENGSSSSKYFFW
jgi:hypothetical protein